MSDLEGWTRSEFTADGVTHGTYRRGEGPGVIVIHEIPGITPQVRAFAEEVVEQGHTVVMPHLFGTPGAKVGPRSMAQAAKQICVSREFLRLATGTTTPVATWLRALAKDLHAELGGPGVGAVGMCFTGGYALAMLAGAPIAAPVLAQPSAPFAVTPGRGRDLGLSPADLDSVKDKVSAGCQVLGLRYQNDLAVGRRFDTLREELGDNFIAVEFPGIKHSTLTLHRQQEAVDAVLAFFKEKLAV
ncbi:dienelactone hydrolase [Nocardioides silvaticus]|uniref:Dienelactone hydrolase n=1 Tax=Nocardioides silvaticus TaxID=2201891 RepID=A0A316TN90_9ACTN|nr:dienelactone hydrolase family protein [Nocardioides silvaticus]PWN04689.1 dienelactone hydrolase [Nocardioides silvaticus]